MQDTLMQFNIDDEEKESNDQPTIKVHTKEKREKMLMGFK